MGLSNSRAADNRRQILAGIRGQATTGDVFYVDSTNGSAADTAGRGKTPGVPFATLDFADTQCADNNGDTIILMPGHAETIATGTALTVATIGLTVVGLGNGTDQPTFTLSATGSEVNIDANNITIENIHFISTANDVAICLDVNAHDFTCRECRFTDTAASQNFLVCIQDATTSGSHRITVEGCIAHMVDPLDTHFVNFAGAGNGHIIRDNIIMGQHVTMCIGGVGIITQCTITGNTILNESAGSNLCISLAATCTGVVSYNACGGGHASDGIVVGTCVSIENYYEDHDSATSGILEPAA